MKRAILFWLLGHLSISAFAASRITVDQLDKVVAASQGERDAKIAGRLATMELTERLSASKLAAIEAALPGPESRRALVMLADQAAFLAPPPTEIPNDPTPTFQQQRAMIAKTVDYVRVLQVRLPNLFARRDTIHFEDTPPGMKLGTSGSSSGDFNAAQPLHPVSRTSATVLYRDGQDFVQTEGKEQSASNLTTTELSSFGEFGPILSTVLVDLPQGKLAWRRWEQGSTGALAVFSFSMPKASSHYAVRFCCVGKRPFQQFSGYHGELTISPDDGTILRLMLMADLYSDDPITKAALMVEYGPVELGGHTYFCPTKSIAISLAMDQAASRGTMSNGVGRVDYRALAIGDSPKQLMINEVVFDRYHLFTSESRVLTTENSTPSSVQDSQSASAVPPETALASSDNHAPVPAAALGTANDINAEAEVTAAQSAAASSPSVTAPTEPATPEISVTSLQTPSIPDVAPNTARFSLHVTTRIVEISVSAFDKKGQPVTDLTRDDFDMYDGGKKQSLRSSGHTKVASGSSQQLAGVMTQPAEYTNRVDAAKGAQIANAVSTTIIYFDATSLSFNDLTHAREQVLKVLGTLPVSEPVGLYIRLGYGFRVLLEGTTDRTAISAALRGWMLDARDLARAQEAEERNRQQFDTLRTPSAVMSVYATVGLPGGGQMIGSDPKLMSMGYDQPREALTVLRAVATHMGAIPGHKNLVWIASDNVLADWTDQSADGDAGRISPNSIGTFAIPTQEALNNAHVSLYAFNASQLETDATDASLQNAGVQLNPSAKDLNPGFKTPPGGRSFSQLRQQTHPVQIAFQRLAESTGGRAFNRSSNVVSNLSRVIEDGKAIYLVSFAPDTQPDDKYHQLKVTVPARRDITLRHRTGYLYSKDPTSLKDRFAQALWQPFDSIEIALNAHKDPASGGAVISLNIGAFDVNMTQRDDRWTGKLDIFLVQQDDTGVRACLREQTLALGLTPASYEKAMRDGIHFEQFLDSNQNARPARIVVVDENSGRIGSITLPAK